MKTLIESGAVDFGFGIMSRGNGYVEFIDMESDETVDGELEWSVWGRNTAPTLTHPGDVAEAELLGVTVEAFGRTYDVTEEVRALIDEEDFQEKALEMATEDYMDAEADRADRAYDEWKDRGI